MVLLLFFSFLAGLVTILAPCIWPLLPIILSSSTTGTHHKSLGITLGIMTSFSVFTLSISYLVMLFHFDPNILRLFAVVVIFLLGVTMIVPAFTEKLEGFVGRLSGMFGGVGSNRAGFMGGYVTGFSLGLIWSPCAGPILATIATLGATQSVSFQLVLVTLFYVLGVGIPLFIFSYGGNVLFTKSRFVSKYTGQIQQIFGVVMIITAIAIYTNYDKVIQAKLLDMFPSYSTFLNKLESNDAVKEQLDILRGTKDNRDVENSSTLLTYGRAPEFTGITNWFNSDPLTMAQLKGKVVLVDFWTYTCINCIRTLPHVTSWYEKYKDKGLVVVGVHTPEFEFEKKTENVQAAIKQYNISYPVALDNDYKTWRAYNNQYWPAKYLIDAKGTIRYVHFGEGKYKETESAIRQLLEEAGNSPNNAKSTIPDQTPKVRLTPEIYLGSSRMQYFYPSGSLPSGTDTYVLSPSIADSSFSLGGTWTIADEYARNDKNAVLELRFTGSKVFLVLRPPLEGNAKVRIVLDGKVVGEGQKGNDVGQDGVVTVTTDRLYNLIELENVENHTLRLEFQTPSIQVFAFTFG